MPNNEVQEKKIYDNNKWVGSELNHTRPRESRADMRKSMAPIRLCKIGSSAVSHLTASAWEMYVLTLKTL